MGRAVLTHSEDKAEIKTDVRAHMLEKKRKGMTEREKSNRKRWKKERKRSGGRSGRGLRRGSGDRRLRGGREEVQLSQNIQDEITHKHIHSKEDTSLTVLLSQKQQQLLYAEDS